MKQYVSPKKLAKYLQKAVDSGDYTESIYFLKIKELATYGLPPTKYGGCVLAAAAIGKAMITKRINLKEVNEFLFNDQYASVLNIPDSIASNMSAMHYDAQLSVGGFIERLNRMDNWTQTDILFAGTPYAKPTDV